MSWYAETYRKIHWDFDNPAFVAGVGARFDAGRFVAELQAARVQSVQFVAKDIFGHAYYDTQIGIRHPKLQFDMVRAVRDACASGHIRLMLYYTVMVDDFVARSHPTWRLNDGERDVVWDACRCGLLCINSPYVAEWVVPQLQELTERYAPDAFFLDHVWAWRQPVCRCWHCRQQYGDEVGGEIPRGPQDPGWAGYVGWLQGKVMAVLERCARAVKDVRPETLLGANHCCSSESPVPPSAGLGYLIEESSDPLQSSFHARYLATQGTPFDVMNTRFAGSWGDWSLVTATALKHAFAPIIANGGHCFLGDKMYPDGRLEPAAYAAIGDAYRFVEQREPLLRDATPVPYVAVLNSAASQYQPASRGLVPLRGVHKALVESGYHCNILSEEALPAALGQYKALVLADQACLSGQTQEAIRRFVADGGGLLASYATSARSADGRLQREFGLADVFGVALEGEYAYSVPPAAETPAGVNYAYIAADDANLTPLPLVVHGCFLNVTPTTGRSLARLVHHLHPDEAPELFAFGDAPTGEDSGYPAVVANVFGKGKVVYVAGELFSSYWSSNAPHLKYLASRLLDSVLQDKLLEVQAPPSVEVSLFKQGARLLVHLTAYHVEKAGGSRAIAESEFLVRDVTVRVRTGFVPGRVVQMPEACELPFTLEGGTLVVCVPEVGIHTCVVIEP